MMDGIELLYKMMRREKTFCDKECFANEDNKCMALSESIREECPFQRIDITMEEQRKQMIKTDARVKL